MHFNELLTVQVNYAHRFFREPTQLKRDFHMALPQTSLSDGHMSLSPKKVKHTIAVFDWSDFG